MRGFFNYLRCAFLNRTIETEWRFVDITKLTLGHSSIEHPKTQNRYRMLNVYPRSIDYFFPDHLTYKRINALMPSSKPIVVTRKLEVVNGNGRVSVLKALGYTGKIQVLQQIERERK
jgi:hypothetical protein